jgi:hypothetical protein
MNQTASKAESQRATPNHNWTLEKLTDYVTDCFKCRDEMNDHLAAIGRKSTVELFRAGHALDVIREKLKADKAYVQWLEDNGIARTTAHDAIKLYYKAKTESAVEKLTITEAKIKFGVTKAKPKKLAVAKRPKDEDQGQSEEERPAELTRADEVLVRIAVTLEEVVQWDRSDLDPIRLDKFARRCITLLNAFLLKRTVSGTKKNSKNRRTNNAA